MVEGIVGRVGRAAARDALCRGFDPCRQLPRGVAVDFGPKQSGWLINQLGNPSLWLKTYKVKSRTGENSQRVTEAYIAPTLRTDLISVKSLNHQR